MIGVVNSNVGVVTIKIYKNTKSEFYGTPCETRTHTPQWHKSLNLACLPIPPREYFGKSSRIRT